MSETKSPKIHPEMMIEDLVEAYPQLIEPLQREYGFHCMNCLLAGFENLAEGAQVHGIVGVELDELIRYLNELVST